MLEVLRGRELTDVVAVVSRWFGGTLLGTGGLSRAYSGATRLALDEVGVIERVLQDLCEVEVDIAAVGRLEHDLRSGERGCSASSTPGRRCCGSPYPRRRVG